MAFDPTTAKLSFDPTTAKPETTDIRSIVSTVQRDDTLDSESMEKVKFTQYLKAKGYEADLDTADLYRTKLFSRDSSYSAVNKQLSNELAVEPLGQVKKSAKTSSLRLVPASTVRYTYAGMAGIAGIAQKLIREYGDKDSFSYDMMGEWRKELVGRGDTLSSIWDKDVPQEVKGSLKGQVLAGIGQIFTLPMYAVPAVGALTTVGQVYEEAYSEALQKTGDEGKASDIASLYTVASAPMEIASDLLKIGVGRSAAKAMKGAGASAFKKASSIAVNGLISGTAEGITESAQSATLQGMIDGSVDTKQMLTEGFVGFVVGAIGGSGITAASVYSKLTDAGVKPETAKSILESVSIKDGVKYDSNGIPLQDQGGGNFIFTEENTPKLESAVAQAASEIADNVENLKPDAIVSKEITGHNGGALTTDDISVLQRQPEVIQNLEPSKQADLLKKAVLENDGSALAEYNQGLVGMEETPAIETESQQAEESKSPAVETPTQEELTVYHGDRNQSENDNYTPFDKPNLPFFTTTEKEGAGWFGTPREFKIAPKKLATRDELISTAKELGITQDEEGFWTGIKEATNGAYDGYNENDLVYIPAVRDALVKKGFDAVRVWDMLESKEIDTVIVIDEGAFKQPPTQEAPQQEEQTQLELDNTVRIEAGEEPTTEPITVQEVLSDIDSNKPITVASKKAQRILDFGGNINAVLAKGASLSTRITEIAPKVGIQFRNMYRNIHKNMSDGVNQTSEFVGSYNKAVKTLNEQQILELNAALRMGDFAKVESFGVTGIEPLRAYLLDRGVRLKRNRIENYFPSKVEDYKGLSQYLGTQPKGVFDAQLKAKEKKLGRELTQDERLSTVRGLLLAGDSTFGSDKSRTIENVTPEMMKFYKNPIEMLSEYNVKTSRALALAEFTGKTPILKDGDFDATESIDEIILSSIESGDLDYDNQAKLKEYLKAGINYRANNKAINAYRRMVSLKFVTKIKTSIAQFGDIGANLGENGIRAVLGADADVVVDVMNKEMKLALEDIDVNALDMEIQETKQSQIENALYQPLQRPDALNKVWLARSSFRKWNRMAKQNPKALEEILAKKWGDVEFAKTVVKDLSEGNWTDATKLAGYMQLADFHPISPAEQIKIAMENPAIRIFTVLKSFAFKRYDRIYRESLRDIVEGNSKIVAGGVDKNMDMVKEGSRQVIDGSAGMAKFLIWSVGFESNLEWIWNELKKAMGFAEDKEDDSLVDFYLKNIGRLIPFIDAYDIEQAFQRKDPVRVFTSIAELPEPIGSDIVQTLYKASLEDQQLSEQIDWLKDIPYIGEFAYGKAKKETSKPKRKLYLED